MYKFIFLKTNKVTKKVTKTAQAIYNLYETAERMAQIEYNSLTSEYTGHAIITYLSSTH